MSEHIQDQNQSDQTSPQPSFRSGAKSPYRSKSGKKGPIAAKQGRKPPVQAKQTVVPRAASQVPIQAKQRPLERQTPQNELEPTTQTTLKRGFVDAASQREVGFLKQWVQNKQVALQAASERQKKRTKWQRDVQTCQAILDELRVLEGSNQGYQVLHRSIGRGYAAGAAFNFNTRVFMVMVKGAAATSAADTSKNRAALAALAHELLHAYQFEIGHNDTSKKKRRPTDQRGAPVDNDLLYDLTDEVQAFKRMLLFGVNQKVRASGTERAQSYDETQSDEDLEAEIANNLQSNTIDPSKPMGGEARFPMYQALPSKARNLYNHPPFSTIAQNTSLNAIQKRMEYQKIADQHRDAFRADGETFYPMIRPKRILMQEKHPDNSMTFYLKVVGEYLPANLKIKVDKGLGTVKNIRADENSQVEHPKLGVKTYKVINFELVLNEKEKRRLDKRHKRNKLNYTYFRVMDGSSGATYFFYKEETAWFLLNIYK